MSGFVLQLETTGATNPRKRVEMALVGILDELASGKSSGAIHYRGEYVGKWGMVR